MPSVSVIIPCYNEEATIRLLLDALYLQSYPKDEIEVVIADGMSTDRTRPVVAEYQRAHPDLKIRLVDNPKRVIPSALNRAIENAQGEIIVRLDGHCIPQPDYVARCVSDLQNQKGDLVGGVWEIKPGGEGWISKAIARAAGHPLGVGDARYRYSSKEGAVDTVPFGAFYRSLIDRIGAYDESLLTNEDYEFATRIRRENGIIWMDPAIHSIYFARKNLADLSRQYWRYGYWKYKMLERHPDSIRWRQALPPLFIFSILFLALMGFFQPVFHLLLGGELIAYFCVLWLAGIQSALSNREVEQIFGLPLAIACMHGCWGAGFLWSIIDRDTR